MNLKLCIPVFVLGCVALGGYLYELPFAPTYGTETQYSNSKGILAANAYQSAVPNLHNAGSIVSEGADVIGSNLLNHSGYTGKGIKVAVIDLGFDIYNSEISRNIKEYRSFLSDRDITGGSIGNEKHGTGAAEIIVDIAPDVELYLYNLETDIEFFNLIDHIIGRGDIDIITMSLGWYNSVGPSDGTTRLAQKVNEARASGILWVNSAGNEVEQHWQGQFSDPDGDGWHNFSGNDDTINIGVYSEDELSVILSWWGSPSQDFELCLYEESFGNLVKIECSNNHQPETEPYEIIEHEFENSTTAHIRIEKYNADKDVNFQLFSRNHYFDEYAVAESSILIPADAAGSLSVGAVNYSNDRLESYSSQGPTLDGRIKPDITAPTRVSTATYGTNSFGGTSAAAPHVAGLAALVMQKYPNATADQIQFLLESTVESRHAKSNKDGTGRADASMFVGTDILALDNSNPSCVGRETCFFPNTSRVALGDALTWVNADINPISVASNSIGGEFESESLFRGERYSKTFYIDGTFAYSDILHPWAIGQIVAGTGVYQPPVLNSAKITAPNTVTVEFSKPVDTALDDFIDITLDGERSVRVFTSLAGNGTATITLTFDGLPAETDATGYMIINSIRGVDGTISAKTPVVVTDGQVPILVSAAVTGPNEITATFNEPVTANTVDFTNLIIAGETVSRSIVGVSGSNTIVVSFGGDTVGTGATATLDIGVGITDTNNNEATAETVTAIDGQIPILDTVSITSSNTVPGVATTGDTVTLMFTASEAITIPDVTINGNTVTATSTDDIIWSAQRTIDETDQNRVMFTIDFADTTGNAGVQVNATTDNSVVTTVRCPNEQMIHPDTAKCHASLSGDVTIGLLGSEAPELGSLGEEALAAATKAVDDFNAYLKDKNMDWQLVTRYLDTQLNPEIALSHVQSFNEDGIKIIVGVPTSASVNNVREYINDNDMVLVSCCSSAPSLAIADNVFRMVPDDSQQASKLALHIEKSGIDSIVIIHRDDIWGNALRDALAESFTGTVVDSISYHAGTTDFTGIISQTVAALPDTGSVGIVILGWGETATIMEQANFSDSLKSLTWFGSGDSANDQSLLEDTVRDFAIDTRFSVVSFTEQSNDTTKDVAAHIESEFGRTSPTVYAYTTYDAIWVTGLAIDESQNTTGLDVAQHIPTVAADRVGAIGPNALNDAGDMALANYTIWRIIGEEWVNVGPNEDNLTITGTVFVDTDGDGVKDIDESGYPDYTMIAINVQYPSMVRTTTTNADGMYLFDNNNPGVTLVQAGFFPAGHTVLDDQTSWFRYVTVTGVNAPEPFDVGFHPVTTEEQTDLTVTIYEDANRNGQRDAGESGIPGIDIVVYTYTIGGHILTTDTAGVVVTNTVPADFIIYIYDMTGYTPTAYSYERFDDTAGKNYLPSNLIADDPEPGSTHTIKIGLVPV